MPITKKARITGLTIRLVGAGVGSAGFLVLAGRPDWTVLATALIGMGSIIIAAGGSTP